MKFGLFVRTSTQFAPLRITGQLRTGRSSARCAANPARPDRPKS